MSLIDDEHWHSWEVNGWAVFDTAIPENVRERLQAWVDDVSRTPGAGQSRKHYFERTDAGIQLCRTEAFIDDHSGLAQLLQQGVVPALAAELLGEEALVYKEKINYKPPGGAGFKAHQDATAYDFVSKHVTCLIAVDAMTLRNGCIEFAPYANDELLPDDGDGCIADEVAQALAWRAVEVQAGSVLFFSSYVPHRSATNRSASPRRALYLTYNAASAGDHRASYYLERERQIAARPPGATARVSTIGHFLGLTADPVVEPTLPPKYEGDGERFVDALLIWLAHAGRTNYDESVTQWQHALQSAALASTLGDDELICAALLHDVGHLLLSEHDADIDFLERDLGHERVGAAWLAHAFIADVVEPIRLHVAAKRYLAGADPGYQACLSLSSQRSLSVQGGPMTREQIEAFREQPHADDAILLRRIDDQAKTRGLVVPDAGGYRSALLACLESSRVVTKDSR